MCDKDILRVIPNEDLQKLRDIYKQYFPRTMYVYNFLNSAMKWKSCRFANNVTIMAPYGDWKSGTFVAIIQCNGYEVFVSTLEKDYDILHEVIVNTKMVEWNKRMLVYGVHEDHYDTILKALHNTKFAFLGEIPCNAWWMPWTEALELKIDCSPEVDVRKLEKVHAKTVNSHWPHNFLGSEDYVSFIIQANGGFGIFVKSTNELVAWILRIQIGLGMLHVKDEYKRKGYGALVTKALSREIAQEEINPLATVVVTNKAAQYLFEKIGFRKSEGISYIESMEEYS